MSGVDGKPEHCVFKIYGLKSGFSGNRNYDVSKPLDYKPLRVPYFHSQINPGV